MKGKTIQQGILEAAVQYIENGWAVLPVSKNKKPIISNGSRGASKDIGQAVKWWVDEYPTANVGIATGAISGIWVLDIDMKGGVSGIDSLINHFGDDLEIEDKDIISGTPSGGRHLIYKIPEGRTVNNAQAVLPGVDIRGEGGYIVAPPSSINVDGEWVKYHWKHGSLKMTDAPKWAVKLLDYAKDSRKAVDISGAVTSGLVEGQRDESIFRIACMLEREGIDLDTAKAFIQSVADRCTPPFDREVAAEKVEHVYKNYLTSQGIQKRLDILNKIEKGGNDGNK